MYKPEQPTKFSLSNDKIKKMILEIVQEIDYDIYKDFLPNTSEDYEYSKERMNTLIKIVENYIQKQNEEDMKRYLDTQITK